MSNALLNTPIKINLQQQLLDFIRRLYPTLKTIPLHSPVLGELEKKYLTECIDSDFVSSVGPDISEFERQVALVANAKYAIATVNGTAALELALRVSGVVPQTEVITQAFTFIATANAISHCGADPIFVDINTHTLGLCPQALRNWLQLNTRIENATCKNVNTGKTISACVVMHSFGHPAELNELLEVCGEFHLALIEDAAEAFGSRYGDKPVGAIGQCGIFSFNGNKVITTGGGGVFVTNNEAIANKARHLATTAKQSHPWHFYHDQVGFNYRMPNINASLGLAQLQRLDNLLQTKRDIANAYREFIAETHYQWLEEPGRCRSNYWLASILCRDIQERDELLQLAHEQKIQLRPSWQPLSDGLVYKHCQRDDLTATQYIAERLVNLPSSVAGSCYANR